MIAAGGLLASAGLIASAGLEWTGVAWRLGATLFFVLLNGFFVAAEFALVKVRRTIGGHVVARLGRFPRRGDLLEVGPYRVTVLEAGPRRVARLRFELPGAAGEPRDPGPDEEDTS